MDRNIFAVGDSSRSGDAPSAVGSFPTSCSTHHQDDAGQAGVFTALPHVTDLATYMIRDVIAFSKSLTNFK